jgi:hypothetical protein
VFSLASAGGFLFAGGDFTEAGGVPASKIAKWDGASWSALGSGTNATVRALASDGTYLYAGGDFATAGGKPSSYFGRWDGLLGPCEISVTQPSGGAALCGGENVNILWTHGGACGEFVRIELLHDGDVCAEIDDSTENDGVFAWTVAPCGGATTGYAIRVTDLQSGAFGTTNGTFDIGLPCAVDLTAPDGGEHWVAGLPYEVTWSSLPCCGDSVRLELLRDGQPCATIAASTPNDGSFTWEATQCGGHTEGYRVAVHDLETGASDTSAAAFRIGPAYRILSIADVGNDQGRQVRVRWYHQRFDAAGSDTTIVSYSVFRRIDQNLAGRPALGDAERAALRYPPGDWDFVKSVPAYGEETYSTICPTLCDSTIAHGMCWSTFFVRAGTSNPLVFFDALPDSGYSLDNLAPGVPGNLRFSTPTLLAWDESEDTDFDYFTVYGSSHAELDSTAVLVGHTTGTTRDVSGSAFAYYHVTATDFSGNEGGAASIGNTTGVSDTDVLPAHFALHAATPNPAAGGVTMAFDLPTDSDVTVKVFDASGRLVATLVDGTQRGGRHTVGAGVYFCRMVAGEFTQTQKVVVVR